MIPDQPNQYIPVYNSNPLLKRTNVVINFTNAQIQEWIKCAGDCEYFVENYVKIVNVDHGLMPFQMYPYQRKMVNIFQRDRFVITKMPRQTGKSTTVTSYILWKILFQDQQNCAILANKGQLARDLLEKVKLSYENLPKWIQQGVVTWNKGSIELENGSKVMAASTSSSAIRGGSYNFLLLDEFAFVPTNMAEEFFNSVYPTISSGKTSQVIIVSTPCGLNHYHKMWVDAINKKSEYTPIEVLWNETPGRDDAWREQQIRNTSQRQWDQEFACEFLGSSDTLISGKKLRELAEMPCNTLTKDNWSLDIYDKPEKKHNYIICADTSHGVGLDYSAFTVIDVTDVPYKMVAKFYDNQTSPMMYPEAIMHAALYYNDAWVLCENNDVGYEVVSSLYRDLEYENVITTVNKGRAGQKVSSGHGAGVQSVVFGLKMTPQVKRIGCANLKDLIECDKLIINDRETIEELSHFVKTPQSYEAEEGFHDDLCMSLVLFGWLCRQQYFRDLTNSDIRNKIVQEKYAEVWDDLLPAGFIDTGRDEVDAIDGTVFDPSWDGSDYKL